MGISDVARLLNQVGGKFSEQKEHSVHAQNEPPSLFMDIIQDEAAAGTDTSEFNHTENGCSNESLTSGLRADKLNHAELNNDIGAIESPISASNKSSDGRTENIKRIKNTVINMARGFDDEGNLIEYNEAEYNAALDAITTDNIADVISDGKSFHSQFVNVITGMYGSNEIIKDRAEKDTERLIHVLNLKMDEMKSPLRNFMTLGIDLNKELIHVEEDIFPEVLELPFEEKRVWLSGSISYLAYKVKKVERDTERYTNALNVNGKIDGVPVQQTGNCWVHAAIQAMDSTEKGRQILSSNISRNPKAGITTVTLPGAGKNYEITDKELFSGKTDYSDGDADMTAYAIAIERYLRENRYKATNLKNTLMWDDSYSGRGNTMSLAFMLLGAKSVDIGNPKTSINKYNFATLKAAVRSGQSAILAYHGHLWSVTGIDESGNLLIQESNNSPECARELVGEGSYEWAESEDGSKKIRMHLSQDRFYRILPKYAIPQF